jgi:hypothetical protein
VGFPSHTDNNHDNVHDIVDLAAVAPHAVHQQRLLLPMHLARFDQYEQRLNSHALNTHTHYIFTNRAYRTPTREHAQPYDPTMFGRERVVGVADGNAFREGFLGKTFHCVKFCFGSRALLGNSCKIRFVYMIFVYYSG